MLLSFLLVIPSYSYVVKLQKEVVMIFLHINMFKIKSMFNAAESFMNKLQTQEEEDISEDSHNGLSSDDEDKSLKGFK